MMRNPAPTVMQIAQSAGGAFAERTSAIDPTPEEAGEEYRRAKAYREAAPLIGGLLGGVVVILVVLRR
jgi:hypothetical protein